MHVTLVYKNPKKAKTLLAQPQINDAVDGGDRPQQRQPTLIHLIYVNICVLADIITTAGLSAYQPLLLHVKVGFLGEQIALVVLELLLSIGLELSLLRLSH